MMKKIYLTIFVAMAFLSLKAQTFSFTMHFRDAAGNTDSIILGYSPTATDSIDTALGEVNIINMPLDTGLDVRIANPTYNNRFTPNDSIFFQTKKQILHNDSSCSLTAPTICIYTSHWPVTATWDSSLFADNCKKGSFFTGVPSFGWGDVAAPCYTNAYRIIFHNKDSITFTDNYDGTNQEYGDTSNGDTVSYFWMKFSAIPFPWLGIKSYFRNNPVIKVYPNPSSQVFNVSLNGNANVDESDISVLDALGKQISAKIVRVGENSFKIDMGGCAKGIYILRLQESNKTIVTEKMLIVN